MVLALPTLTTLKVRGRLLQFASDSNDPGTAVDQQPTLGTVEFTADYKGIRPLTHPGSKSLVALVPVVASIRADGVVCPPQNGVAPASDEEPTVSADPFTELIAPQGNGFTVEDWSWTAKWRPAPGQKWREFTQVIPAQAAGNVDLSDLAAVTATTGVAVPLLYSVASTTDPLPTGFRVGTDLVRTPDGSIYGTRSV